MSDFMESLEDFMVSFAAISGTYMLIGSIAILILFKMNRPLLLRICRAAIKTITIVLALLFVIDVLYYNKHSLTFFALLIGNLMCLYVCPRQK